MQLDPFTKATLVGIALFLGLIALRPFVASEAAQAGAGDFDHVRYLGRFGIGNQSGNLLLDARTGDIWGYGYGAISGGSPSGGSPSGGAAEVLYIGRLTKLGEPLVGK
jgi:hypothetical protein